MYNKQVLYYLYYLLVMHNLLVLIQYSTET